MDVLTIGIDIGGTNFRIGTVSENDEIYNFEKNSSRIFDSGDVVSILCKEITSYIERYNIQKKIKGVAIGIPSMVSKDKRTIISTPNLKGFDNIEFSNLLEQQLKLPVWLDRDVNFLLLNDIRTLNLDASKTILGFYIGTGFGNAIYIEGKLYAGKNGAAGELGHIPFIDYDDICTCGNRGCSEVRCSGKYLEKLTKEHFPDTKIQNIFQEHAENPIIQKYVRDLAVPIATEINILDPDYSILAGGVVYMQGFPKELLISEIKEKVRKPYPAKNLEIFFSEHTQQSGVYGSGQFAHLKLRENKK